MIEYLKGTGGDELAAIVYDIHDYDSEEQAMEVAVLIPDQIHDERWKDHQAIVFVEEDVVEANGLLTSHPYQFVIAGTGVPSLGNFHIDSDYNKAWLSRAGQRWTTAVSLCSINVSVSDQHKCHQLGS